MRHLLFIGLIVLLTTHAIARADPAHATAELIADAKTVEPGGTFTVGLRMKMKPTWHVYWLNPGDSGMATTFDVEAPEGWLVGSIAWPTPQKFFDGTFTTYGYEHEVLLTRAVSVPDDAKPGTNVTLRAKAEWLVCDKDACIAGDAAPSVTIKIGAHREPSNKELFAAWNERLPSRGRVSEWMAYGSIPDEPNGIRIVWREPATDVDWYPAATAEMLVEDLKVKTEGKVTTVRYKFTSLTPEGTTLSEVPGVLVFTDPEGVRRAWAVTDQLRAKVGETP